MTNPDTPLVDAVRRVRNERRNPLQIPTHRGRYAWAPDDPGGEYLADIVRDDVPLQGGADDNAYSEQLLERAEGLWSEALGVARTRFLVGGSSQGNIAALTAVGSDGQTIAVDRTSHRSMHAGLIVSGAMPRWIYPTIHPELGIPIGIDVDAAIAALPGARAVTVTSPSYVGTLSDIASLVDPAHAQGVAVIADQAWGAHLDFLANGGAINQGADLIVTSIHKALLGYSQTAVCMLQGDLVDPNAFDRAVDLIGTTSPSATLLASIDATRAFMVDGGTPLLDQKINLVAQLRESLRRIPGVVVVDERELDRPTDPMKVVLWLPRTGVTGSAIGAALWEMGHGVESADADTLALTMSILDTPQFIHGLADLLGGLIESMRGDARTPTPSATWTIAPEVVISPRQAYFAKRRRMPLAEAAGRISAEQFCPYPPGIPLIAPGERVTKEIIEAIAIAGTLGRVAFNSDPTLRTIEVVDDI